jgi:hypothetical protein
VEQIGYFLWEVITFSTILFAGIGLLVLRRRASGSPAFTDRDRQLFFGHPEVKLSKPRFCINFGIAVFLCYLAGSLEYLLLAGFGASILATAQLITFLGIVKKSLCY